MERGVEEDGVIERVLTDQHRRDIARDDAERGEAALHRRRFADAVVSVIRVDADKGAALLRLFAGSPADLKRLDVADFHYASEPRPSRPHAGGMPAFQSVIGDFDEVVVRMEDVDELDRSERAGARAGTGDDRHAAMPEMRNDLGERRLGDKAEIARARGRPIRDEAGDVIGRVQIDLLLAEAQRRAALAEGDDLHTENSRVELTGACDIGDGQNEVIETRDLHGRPRNPFRGAELAMPDTPRPSHGGRKTLMKEPAGRFGAPSGQLKGADRLSRR